MSNVLAKVKSALGLGEYEDYEEYENDDIQEEEEEEVGIEPVIQGNKRNAKVVNLHTAVSPKVTVVKPLAYEQATEISDALNDKKIVVVNTTALENRIAQRLLDFISGSCYALCGELQEVEKGVYLLAPSNVEVSNDLKNELSSKAFSWSK